MVSINRIFDRKLLKKWLFIISVLGVLCYSLVGWNFGKNDERDEVELTRSISDPELVLIGVVICGNQSKIEGALVMMKSAILFRGSLQIHFHIVCMFHMRNEIHAMLQSLRARFNNVFTYELHNTSFPKGNEKFWHSWYKECATQRLFFANIFPDIEKILYIDNDVLFLNELADLWMHSYKMDQSQMIAVAPDYLDPAELLKNNNPKYPLSKAKGLNTGVLIMDLKKMREFGWVRLIISITETYYKILPFGDQDVIRLALFFHPDKLYPLPCNYNFHKYHCTSKVPCQNAVTNGISVLHGCADAFIDVATFKAIHEAVIEHEIGTDTNAQLVELWKQKLEKLEDKECGHLKSAFLKNIDKLHSP